MLLWVCLHSSLLSGVCVFFSTFQEHFSALVVYVFTLLALLPAILVEIDESGHNRIAKIISALMGVTGVLALGRGAMIMVEAFLISRVSSEVLATRRWDRLLVSAFNVAKGKGPVIRRKQQKQQGRRLTERLFLSKKQSFSWLDHLKLIREAEAVRRLGLNALNPRLPYGAEGPELEEDTLLFEATLAARTLFRAFLGTRIICTSSSHPHARARSPTDLHRASLQQRAT